MTSGVGGGIVVVVDVFSIVYNHKEPVESCLGGKNKNDKIGMSTKL